LKPQRFATHSLAPSHQLDAWRGWFDSVFDVMPLQSAKTGFRAESEIRILDGFAVSQVSAPPLRDARTKTLVRRNPIDHWCLTLGHAATGIRTRNTSRVAPAHLPFVVSLGYELVSERREDERLHFYLSRDSFRDIAPILDAAQGATVVSRLGILLADYMRMLTRRLPDLAPEDLPRLKAAICAMIGACLAPSTDRVAGAAIQIDLGLKERIRRIVRTHLRSPLLGTEMLCRAACISRSRLYRLLEGEGGVVRYIRRQRLLEAYAELCDVSNTRSIAAIAYGLCFADPSTFSRMFRQEFDASPGEVRAATRTGIALAPLPRDRVDAEFCALSHYLRAF
jgi:AraC-like DNA-binding protein